MLFQLWAVTELGVIRVRAQLPGGAWPAEVTADRLLLLSATGKSPIGTFSVWRAGMVAA
jgi:hypothetical protein